MAISSVISSSFLVNCVACGPQHPPREWEEGERVAYRPRLHIPVNGKRKVERVVFASAPALAL